MTKETASTLIPRLKDFFSTQPVSRVWLFGSFSRGEESEKSDVDILLEFDKRQKITLFTMGHIYSALTKMLHRAVDLVEIDTLMPYALPSVNRDKILIYERKNP